MTLQEMLETPEAKRMYRELAMKYHPDKGGSTKTMRKINAAKQAGDVAMKRIYRDIKGGKKSSGYDDTEKEKTPFNYSFQEFAEDYEEFLNKHYKDLEIKFHLIIKKFNGKSDLLVSMKFPNNKMSQFSVSDMGRFKDNYKLSKFIIKKVSSYIKDWEA